jgi:hypothetical protein
MSAAAGPEAGGPAGSLTSAKLFPHAGGAAAQPPTMSSVHFWFSQSDFSV